MKLKALILDFDGVIIESNGIKTWAFEELFKKYPDRLDEIMAYHRKNPAVIRFEKFKYITQNILNLEYTDELKTELAETFSGLVLEKVIRCDYVNGALEFLEYFKKRMPIYLASVNPEDDLMKVLSARNLKSCFKRVYTTPWEKRNAILDILRHERIQNDETVFVGDSREDCMAAKEANVPFVGRQSDRSFEGMDVPVFDDLKEVQAFLLNEGVKVG